MKTYALVLALCLLPRVAVGQPLPVNKWADAASYGTALVNPVTAAVVAWRGPDRWCHLERIGLAELIGNVSTIGIKHLVRSERPCLGCAPDGMPSGHTMNSFIGYRSFNIGYGIAWGGATGGLRMAAHRHTPWQVLAGAAIGIGSTELGNLLRCGK